MSGLTIGKVGRRNFVGEELRIGKISLSAPAATDLARRLWEQVEKSDGCWLWTGYLRHGRYGSIYHRGRNYYVHRLAYALQKGDVPAGQCVCHRCDIPNCVHPDHLFLGTQADNVEDMHRKGRDRKIGSRGLRNGNAHLTDEEVEGIRAAAATGESQRSIGQRYNCSQSTVWRIVRRQTRAEPTP